MQKDIVILLVCGIVDVLCGARILLQKHRMLEFAENNCTMEKSDLTYEMRKLVSTIIGNAAVLSILFFIRPGIQMPAVYGCRLGVSWAAIFGMVWGMKRFYGYMNLLRKE